MKYLVLMVASAAALTAALAGCGTSVPNVGQEPAVKPSAVSSQSPSIPGPPPSSSDRTVPVSGFVTAPSQPPPAAGRTAEAPVIMGMAGALESNTAWPLKGAAVASTGTPMSAEQFTTSGFVIDGVHWTWPREDSNPADYLVVPTVVAGHPYLVWAHLGAYTGSWVSQDPTQPAELWMTPWVKTGGSLSAHAELLTGDIPPVWSKSERMTFSSSGANQSMAGSAWTGWFQWGTVQRPYAPHGGTPGASLTVAWPRALYPAYNGVVL